MKIYRNPEHYPDPTAGTAISHVMKTARRKHRRGAAGKRQQKIYVASKYAGDVPANVDAAIRYCRYVIDQGHIPVASHLLYPQMLDDSNPAEREMGLRFGIALLAVCDEVWVFGEISAGVAREIAEATARNKRLRYFGEGSV